MQDPQQRQPLFDVSGKEKSSKETLSSFFDEDMQFIIDTYQEGLKRVRTPHAENKMRGTILRKICRKKAPDRVPLLDQIDKITADIQKEKISFPEGISILENIARKYGDPRLVRGIEHKANELRKDGQEAATKIIQLFGQDIEVRQRTPLLTLEPPQKRKPLVNITQPLERKPLADLSPAQTTSIARFASPPKKREQHPMALFLQQTAKQQRKQPKQKKRASRQPLLNVFQPIVRRPLLPPQPAERKRRRK